MEGAARVAPGLAGPNAGTPGAGEPVPGAPSNWRESVIRFWFGRHASRRTRIRFSLHLTGRFPARFASSFGEATAAASDLAAGPVGPNVRWAARSKSVLFVQRRGPAENRYRVRLDPSIRRPAEHVNAFHRFRNTINNNDLRFMDPVFRKAAIRPRPQPARSPAKLDCNSVDPQRIEILHVFSTDFPPVGASCPRDGVERRRYLCREEAERLGVGSKWEVTAAQMIQAG